MCLLFYHCWLSLSMCYLSLKSVHESKYTGGIKLTYLFTFIFFFMFFSYLMCVFFGLFVIWVLSFLLHFFLFHVRLFWYISYLSSFISFSSSLFFIVHLFWVYFVFEFLFFFSDLYLHFLESNGGKTSTVKTRRLRYNRLE